MASADIDPGGRLYFLDLDFGSFPAMKGRLLTSGTDGSDLEVLVAGLDKLPDGIIVDAEQGHIYWTNIGHTPATPWDGSIQRCDLSGNTITTIVPEGIIYSPKQLTLARHKNGPPALYWTDREGMRIMRCNLDGSNVETLVVTGDWKVHKGDQNKFPIGVTVDTESEMIYWTQKGPPKGSQGRIFRAPIAIKAGEDPAARTDVDVILEGLPEPIDIDIDMATKTLYWTDRGELPWGNTVNCAVVEDVSGLGKVKLMEKRILVRKLHEGLGISLDTRNRRMFFTDLGGSVYSANMDGSNKKIIHLDAGECTGISYVAA